MTLRPELPGRDAWRSKEEIPSKEARLEMIFKLIEGSPNAKSMVEASDLMERAFDEIEKEFSYSDGKMFAYHHSYHKEIPNKGKTVYFQPYFRHTAFIGENGAIEVRENTDMFITDEMLQKDPAHALERMKPVFEKAGADGKGVWD